MYSGNKTLTAFSHLLLSPTETWTSTLTRLAAEVSRKTHSQQHQQGAGGLLELSVEGTGHHKGTVGWKVNLESCA